MTWQRSSHTLRERGRKGESERESNILDYMIKHITHTLSLPLPSHQRTNEYATHHQVARFAGIVQVVRRRVGAAEGGSHIRPHTIGGEGMEEV